MQRKKDISVITQICSFFMLFIFKNFDFFGLSFVIQDRGRCFWDA